MFHLVIASGSVKANGVSQINGPSPCDITSSDLSLELRWCCVHYLDPYILSIATYRNILTICRIVSSFLTVWRNDYDNFPSPDSYNDGTNWELYNSCSRQIWIRSVWCLQLELSGSARLCRQPCVCGTLWNNNTSSLCWSSCFQNGKENKQTMRKDAHLTLKTKHWNRFSAGYCLWAAFGRR